MLIAADKNGNKVIGWEAKKEDNYYCPSCEEQLILRQGEIKVHHFAHIAENGCRHGAPETELHLWMKKCLYQRFSKTSLYQEVKLEYRIGDCIADIYLKNMRKQEIAIECQTSSLDITEFRRKTAYYSYRGIYTLWLFSGNIELDKRMVKLVHSHGSRLNYSADEVERKCHRWFYGRIYYFYNDKIYAIHFHPIERWVPSSCDECLEQTLKCPYPEPTKCPKYRPGYFRRPKALMEISIYPIIQPRLMCVDRKDKLRIAKFNEPAWWKV